MNYITEYETYLRASHRSHNSILAYVSDVNLMLRHVNKPCNEIKFMDLVSWQDSMQGLSTSTLHRRVVAVQDYFEFLKANEVIANNPASALQFAKVRNKKKPDPENWMISALVDHSRTYRDKAFIMLVASTGMRFDEASNITIGQFKARRFSIIGKGDKEREIFINERVASYIDRYLTKRSYGHEDSDLVFMSSMGNKMDNCNFNTSLKSTAKRAGLACANEISAHWLRHAFATMASQMGAPVADISSALGHSDLKVTTTYIHTPQNRVVNIMNNIEF